MRPHFFLVRSDNPPRRPPHFFFIIASGCLESAGVAVEGASGAYGGGGKWKKPNIRNSTSSLNSLNSSDVDEWARESQRLIQTSVYGWIRFCLLFLQNLQSEPSASVAPLPCPIGNGRVQPTFLIPPPKSRSPDQTHKHLGARTPPEERAIKAAKCGILGISGSDCQINPASVTSSNHDLFLEVVLSDNSRWLVHSDWSRFENSAMIPCASP